MKYKIISFFLLPSVSSGYILNNTSAVLTKAKPTFEQQVWPYVGGHVMGAKSMIEAFKKTHSDTAAEMPYPHNNFT